MQSPDQNTSVIRDEFNGLAPEYESNRLAPWYQAHAERLLRHCPLPGQGPVLDVGCGTGHLLRRFLQDHPQVSAIGLDIAQEMVAMAKQKASHAGMDHLDFLCGDFETIDPREFDPPGFATIFCVNAFHYFSNPQRAMDKFYHLLEDGGVLYVLERDKAQSMLTSFWALLHHYVIKDHVQFLAGRNYRNLARIPALAG